MAQYSYNPDWASAIASIESAGSGGYSAIGAPNSRGSRAYGRYQVMDFNIPDWTKRYVGKRLTPEEFLNSPEAQDAVFQGQFGSLVQRYGNERDAASAWFTGRPVSAAGSDTDVHGRYTGASYADAFQKALGNPNVINAGIGSDALVALGKTPAAGQSQSGVLAAGAKPMAMMDTQPQGLLERMGLQRMNPEAQGETAMPFYQRPSFLDFAKGVGLGLSQLSTRPSQAAAQQLAQLQQDRSQRRSANQTLAWLASQPGGEMYVQMLQAGANPAAVLQSYMQAQQQAAVAARGEIKEVDGKLVRVMPDGTVDELYAGQGYDPEDVVSFRKEFTALPAVKEFTDVGFSYARILNSISDPSPAGDLALIFNYMKILDPGSTVREGEFANAQNAGGVDTRIVSLYNQLREGTRLTEEQRADFANRATKLYKGAEEIYQATAENWTKLADLAGLPVEQVIPNFGYSGELYQTPLLYRRPPPPQNVSQADWELAWANMTDDERRSYLGE